MYVIVAILAALVFSVIGPARGGDVRGASIHSQDNQQTNYLYPPVNHRPQRWLKGDRTSRLDQTDPPGEVASIEIGNHSGLVVLRGYAGDVAFWVDPSEATTSVAKGISIPQLVLPSTPLRSEPPVQDSPRPQWLSSLFKPEIP